jgi:CBS domain-containing protein
VRRLLSRHPFHHVPVLDGELLVGILSSHDLLRLSLTVYEDSSEMEDAWLDASSTIRKAMTPEPEALYPEDPISRAASILGDGSFHALPVIDREGRLKGMVTSTDLIRYLANRC